MTLTNESAAIIHEQVKSLLDASCHPDSNIQHLVNVLIGYRETVIDPTCQCEYASPGSARAESWKIGQNFANNDLQLRLTP